jgi:hypothetical protein
MRLKIRAGIMLTVAAVIAVLPLSGVLAQTNSQAGGQGLEISPPLIELAADPGQTLKTTIQIRNITTGTLIAKPQTNDFTSNGVDGLPQLQLDEGEPSPFSIRDWIAPIPDTRLEKDAQASIEVTIAVPANASPGAHFGVIRFTGVPPELENNGVSLSASLGSLVFITVSGDAVEKSSIQEIRASQNGEQGTFFEKGPITLTQIIKNDGNTFVRPNGTVRVTDIFGKEAGSYPLNQDNRLILPGSTREFTQQFEKGGLFGRYTMQVDMVYGTDNTIVSESMTFWVIPYKLVAVGLLVIALIILAIRQYTRYVVRKTKGGRSGGSKFGRK